jgi:hypothetical protein
MANDVVIDYPTVQTMADVVGTAADTLKGINSALSVVEGILIGTAFIGFVGGAAAMYIENVRGNVDNIAGICTELSNDLNGAIKALRDGDFSGSQRFV